MGNPLSQPNNKPAAVGQGASSYRRKSAAVVPTALPMKRQPEGSVLSSGAQPDSRGSGQKMSKKLKGGAD